MCDDHLKASTRRIPLSFWIVFTKTLLDDHLCFPFCYCVVLFCLISMPFVTRSCFVIFSILSAPLCLCSFSDHLSLSLPTFLVCFIPSLTDYLHLHSLIFSISPSHTYTHIQFFSYCLQPPWELPASPLWSWPFAFAWNTAWQIDFLVSSSVVASL